MAAAVQIFIITDKVVEGFHLPECCPSAFQNLVGLTRAEAEEKALARAQELLARTRRHSV